MSPFVARDFYSRQQTTVYVQNRSPHRVLGNKTPKEMFSGEKPEVSHLKIFGCPVCIHVPKEKRTKLEPSGVAVDCH